MRDDPADRAATRTSSSGADAEARAALESAEQLRIAVEVAKLGTWQLDLRSGALTCSERCKANFGLAAGDEIGYARLFELVHRNDRARVRATIEAAIARRTDCEAEFRVVWPDGSLHWIIVRGRAFEAGEGRAASMVGVTLDVTERKRADAAARERADLFQVISEGTPTLLYAKDREGRMQMANLATLRVLGKAAEDIIGKTARETWRDKSAAERVMANDRRLMESGVAQSFEEHVPMPDGVHVFLSTKTPQRDEAGAVVGLIGASIDITERKHAEEALRLSQAQLEAELADSKLLYDISSALIRDDEVESLYRKIIGAATAIMRSDFASMQMLHPERGSGGELRLLAFQGFDPAAAKFWEWVRADSVSTCGEAFRRGGRVVVADVTQCGFMAGSEDLAACLRNGIRAVQSTPLLSRDGKVVGMISTHWRKVHEPSDRDLRLLDILARQAADLIERRMAEGRRTLLINELNHRVKNTLATVQSMARQTARGATSTEAFVASFEGRLLALSRAHDLVTRGNWEEVGMRDVVETTMAPHRGLGGHRILSGGPDFRLSPRRALMLSMALHELSTNAAKYGALSIAGGHVAISWGRAPGSAVKIELRWVERDGPEVQPPRRKGFGSRLIENALADELAGEVRLTFERDGVRCVVVFEGLEQRS